MGKLLFFPTSSVHGCSAALNADAAGDVQVSSDQVTGDQVTLHTSKASNRALALMEEAADLLESLGGAEREVGWILDDLVRMLSGSTDLTGDSNVAKSY